MWITIFCERNIYRSKDGDGVTSLLQPCAVSSKTQEHATEKLKNPAGDFENAPPPPQKKMTFVFGSAAPNAPITQTLLLSENFFIFTLKYF